ncbi:hypothetical protein N3K66_002711 [Trichothecium roseum]|uniref:Uncharacterized protein n=1 Tax=Trichothecium roseum TaxID=47278 RepID=A0ACC0VAX8_9HYPO|nr:hypothetical protein N3K66_002711 [Trichothecium roseum]
MPARLSSQILSTALTTASPTRLSSGIRHLSLRASPCDIFKNSAGQHLRTYAVQRRLKLTRKQPVSPPPPPLPTLSELRAEMEKPGSPYIHASPEDYYKTLELYAEAVETRGGGRWWAATFPSRKDRPSLKVVHHLACILRDGLPASHPYWMGMWAWASDQGYVPSTIQLATSMNTLRGLNTGAWNESPEFVKKAEIRFRQLAKAGTDPNVLTVQAEMLRDTGNPQASLDTVKQAFKIGGDDFELLPRAKLALATAFNDLGRAADALQVLESVIHLDLAELKFQVGKALAAEKPAEAREWFYKASLSGYDAGFLGLAMMEEELIKTAVDKETEKIHILRRDEWKKMTQATV